MSAVRLLVVLIFVLACCDGKRKFIKDTRVKRAQLYFKVSARNLEPTYQKVYRPYVYVETTTDGGKTYDFVGQSEYAAHASENPKWNRTFYVPFNRRKNQSISFLINEPNWVENHRHYIATLVSLAEYVDSGENLTVPIGNSSFVHFYKTTDNIEHLAPYEPPQKLNFTVLASQCPYNEQMIEYTMKGFPFLVTIFHKTGNGTMTKLGETPSYSGSNLEKRKDVWTIQYDQYKDDRIVLEINSTSPEPHDSYIEHWGFSVNDYVDKGQAKFKVLKNGGSVSFRKLRKGENETAIFH